MPALRKQRRDQIRFWWIAGGTFCGQAGSAQQQRLLLTGALAIKRDRSKQKLRDVREKVLAAQLRELETDWLLCRKNAQTVPPRVDHSLSPSGAELIPNLEPMWVWAGQHLGVLPSLPPREVLRA